MDFSALKQLTFKKPVELQKTTSKGRKLSCNEGDFAITKSGKILFSSRLRNEIEVEPENKFIDIIDGNKMNPAVPCMFMAIVPGNIKESPRAIIKQEGKVASIDAFVKPTANSVYGINWEVKDKVEFAVLWDNEVTTEEPYFYFPCLAQNGSPSYNKREAAKTKLFPVVPFEATKVVQTEIPFEENLIS